MIFLVLLVWTSISAASPFKGSGYPLLFRHEKTREATLKDQDSLETLFSGDPGTTPELSAYLDQPESSLFSSVRVLCWVMTEPQNHETKARHVKDTWGRSCNKLVFMSSQEDPSLPAVSLQAEEGQDNLKQAHLYLYKNHFDEADWFLKADDDTYVVVENLRYMLQAHNHTDPVYFDFKFNTHMKKDYISGEAGYVLSKEALGRLATKGLATECRRGGDGAEDVEMGKCMEGIGVDVRDMNEHHLVPSITSDWSRDKVKNEEYLQKDLARNLTVINMTNFEFVINNDICNVRRVALVTIIHTAVNHHEARSVIRSSWGNPDIPGVVTKLVFLLGRPEDDEKQAMLEEESSMHGDIIQGDFLDTYHNLSYKAIMGNLWVSEFCDQAEFVVKTDDDMFIDLYEVYHLTRQYLKSSHYVKNRFLLCPVWRGLPILRDEDSKWYASYEQVPKVGEEGTESYPTSCSGWLWITSPGTSQAIIDAAQVVRFFWIDDVWVTGYIAEHLKIEHQDCIQYWIMETEQLLLHKAAQNPDDYCPDYISGPIGRGRGRVEELAMALHRKASWCYTNKCQNNIYSEHPPIEKSEELLPNLFKKFFLF